ncbi:hypothetical protein QSV08_03390 [Maribacter sp. BPC-D8]|uniref:hypothetical protein n=1 Tax=Maribacter sp. BPC-D8 TaxID=3053613 RepID=UPI002B47CDCA|nr:hypothetical protein [Maribacter sp. BPC-D8]WRI30288.1 hypothetical protein QSV08_03390 [Maribacter sp. BPC-D8]
MKVDLIQTSCDFADMFIDFKEERTALNDWSKNQEENKIKEYWKNKNTKSIDGFETNILKN